MKQKDEIHPENDYAYLAKVEEAILKQFEFETTVNKICEEIKNEFSECGGVVRFSKANTFASVQLLSVDKKIIEIVAGKFGENIRNKGWTGISRHHIDEKHENIRDMHANLVVPLLFNKGAPPSIVIVSGWHQNFDRWIYDYYQHGRYVRIFIPIILLRDGNGRIISDDWSKDWSMNIAEPVLREMFENDRLVGFSKEIEMPIPQKYADHEINVIGTVAVGYFHDPSQEGSDKNIPQELINKISIEGTIGLTKLTARKSIEIYKSTLGNVFDTITEQIREKVGAVSTSLHYIEDFLNKEDEVKFHIKSCSGEMSTEFLIKCPVHKGGLGQLAIKNGEMECLEGDDLKKKNPKVYEKGIRVMVASPLIISSDNLMDEDSRQHGILYVHFNNEDDFSPEKKN